MCNNKDAGHITKQHVNVRMLEPLSKEPNESKDWIVVVAAVQLLVHSLHEFTKESFRPIARSSLQPRENVQAHEREDTSLSPPRINNLHCAPYLIIYLHLPIYGTAFYPNST